MFDLFQKLEEQEKLMNKKQVAELLDVTPRTVERMIDSGLPSILIGGQRRFDPAQLHRYFSRKNPLAARERARA